MTDVDRTGENLWNTGFDKGLFEIFHLREHKEIIVDMQFLFLVEQTKRVLDPDSHRTHAVEAS